MSSPRQKLFQLFLKFFKAALTLLPGAFSHFFNHPTEPCIIAKGEDVTDPSTITEILESLIDQHLQAQDFPLSLPAIYTSADGSTWPGLVVDGVYDIGQHYRINLLICSEAAVTRLKARELSKLNGYTATGATIQDEDFD